MINISSNHIKLHVYDDDVKQGKIVTKSMIINHYFEVFIYFFSVNSHTVMTQRSKVCSLHEYTQLVTVLVTKIIVASHRFFELYRD